MERFSFFKYCSFLELSRDNFFNIYFGDNNVLIKVYQKTHETNLFYATHNRIPPLVTDSQTRTTRAFFNVDLSVYICNQSTGGGKLDESEGRDS